MNWKPIAAALVLALAADLAAEDPQTESRPAAPTVTQSVKLGDVTWYRSYEDAFPRARKAGKLVVVYRMLGELDGLT